MASAAAVSDFKWVESNPVSTFGFKAAFVVCLRYKSRPPDPFKSNAPMLYFFMIRSTISSKAFMRFFFSRT